MTKVQRRHRLKTVEIAVDETGERSEHTAPLVLLHGFTGHRDDFELVRDRLGTWTWTLVPDLRGHGDAGTPDAESAYTFEQVVRDLDELLTALGIERCHLLGHSMGGMVALRFALAHPERLASLILMSTSPDVPTDMSAEGLRRAGEIALRDGMVGLQTRAEKRARTRPGDDPADRHLERWADRYWAHHAKRYHAMDPAGYMGLGQAMATQQSVVGRLSEIGCPTSILIGSDDRPFLAGADAFEARIPGAVRYTIENAGHHPHQENAEAWWAAMAAHWERVKEASPSTSSHA